MGVLIERLFVIEVKRDSREIQERFKGDLREILMNTAIRVILGLLLIWVVWMLLHWLFAMALGLLHLAVTLFLIGLFVYIVYQVFKASQRQRL